LYQHFPFLNLKAAAKVVPSDVVGTIFDILWSSISPRVASSAARNTRAFRARVETTLAPQVPHTCHEVGLPHFNWAAHTIGI